MVKIKISRLPLLTHRAAYSKLIGNTIEETLSLEYAGEAAFHPFVFAFSEKKQRGNFIRFTIQEALLYQPAM